MVLVIVPMTSVESLDLDAEDSKMRSKTAFSVGGGIGLLRLSGL